MANFGLGSFFTKNYPVYKDVFIANIQKKLQKSKPAELLIFIPFAQLVCWSFRTKTLY